MAQIDRIYRYPVKGLSAEPLAAVHVAAGEGLPLDRMLRARPPEPRSIPRGRRGWPSAIS